MTHTNHIVSLIFNWAWRCGLDVRLTSRSFQVAIMNPIRFMRDEIKPFNPEERMNGEIPVLTFSRGDRHMEISASNWSELQHRLSYQYEEIFADLACPPLVLDK